MRPAGEHGGDRVVLGERQSQEEVLRADLRVSEPLGLLLGEHDHLPRAPREALEGPGEAPPGAGSGGAALFALDDLVHALVAEPEALGDLAKGSSFGMEPPDRVVVVGPGPLQLVLRLDHPVARALGFPKGGCIEWRHAV